MDWTDGELAAFLPTIPNFNNLNIQKISGNKTDEALTSNYQFVYKK